MVRDALQRRRNAIAIPGWLLILYSLAAILYAEAFRPRSDFCPDGSWVLIDGTCYTVWKLVLPLLLIGIGLALGAAFGLRGHPARLEQHLRHGTPTHVVLAVLISLVVVPALLWIVQTYRQSRNDVVYELTFLNTPYQHTFLLELAILVALLMLIPFVGALIADAWRRRRFLEAAQDVGEEPASEPEPPVAEQQVAEEDVTEESFDAPDGEEWPASRDAPEEEAPHYGYKAPRMDVEELEGIGPKYAALLQAEGVHTTARLSAENAHDLAHRIGVSPAHVESWQAMSELVAVRGIGPQYAEALVRSGITSIAELKRRSPKALAKQVNEYLDGLDTNLLGTAITEARVAGWQKAAQGMRKVRMPVPDA